MNFRISAMLRFWAVGALAVSTAMARPTGWRVDGTGNFPASKLVQTWSTDKHVIWKTALDKVSNASPTVIGKRIFICEEPNTLICLSTRDGRELWRHSLPWTDFLPSTAASQTADQKQTANRRPPCHDIAGYTSATSVSDGKRIYVVFGSGVAGAFSLNGKQKWARLVGSPSHEWGHSSSPLLIDKKLIIHMGTTVMALDPATGDTLWETKSDGTWGTPQSVTVGKETALLTTGGKLVRVSDGKILQSGLISSPWGSPVVDGNTIYIVDENGAMAYQADKEGAKPLKRLWLAKPKKDRYYASPVIHDNIVYNLTRNGFMSAIDASTGDIIYKKKVKLGGTVYPSPCLVGKNLLFSSDTGKMILVKPGRKFEIVAENKLEPFRSTPTIVGNRMYIRTLKALYCIGAK